jgi:diaminopimelate epimerase
VADAREKVSFETEAGIIRAELHEEQVRLTMSEPRDLRLNLEISADGRIWPAHFINSGVPHVVVPVARVDMVDVETQGRAIRRHKMFSPKGANVNFVEKRGPKRIAIRTFERGVEGETLACGTGVVASALIFSLLEKASGPIDVLVRGGNELQVDFERSDDRFTVVTLTGPAEFVFEGTIAI